jgi:hypothetical protein
VVIGQTLIGIRDAQGRRFIERATQQLESYR